MQIVSNRDNLHKMSDPVFLKKKKIKKKNIINVLSAELAQRVVKYYASYKYIFPKIWNEVFEE